MVGRSGDCVGRGSDEIRQGPQRTRPVDRGASPANPRPLQREDRDVGSSASAPTGAARVLISSVDGGAPGEVRQPAAVRVSVVVENRHVDKQTTAIRRTTIRRTAIRRTAIRPSSTATLSTATAGVPRVGGALARRARCAAWARPGHRNVSPALRCIAAARATADAPRSPGA